MAHATVLVVDDEALVRWSLKERLARDGYEVLEAATAAAALEQAGESVDLILLDFRLPDSDGLAVLKRVKELRPNAKVIMVTGLDEEEIRETARQHGASAYITKPFDFSDATWSSVLVNPT